MERLRLLCAFSKIGLGTFRPRELWGSFFDLWFLVPIAGILIDSESGGDARSLGLNFLYLGCAYLLSALIFRTPLPLQPLKVWAFLFLILHPTPMIASTSAVLLGGLLFLSGQLGLTDRLSRILDDGAISGVRRAVSIYVTSVGGLSLVLWALHHLPGIDLSRFTGSKPEIWPHAPGPILEVFLLVLPQLPVTLINGILATVREKQASDTLSEHSRGNLTGNITSCWLGLANLLAGFLGLLPFCHGSGGLRSYRRYNIRTILPSLSSSAVLITLGAILTREKITLPGPAFFALFLAGFLFAEHLIARRDLLKSGAGGNREKANPQRSPLEVWILSGGMISGLIALGGIPAVLVFLLGMNTVLTISKTNHRLERSPGQGAIRTITEDILIPEQTLWAKSPIIPNNKTTGLFMEKSFEKGTVTPSLSGSKPPTSSLLLIQGIDLPLFGDGDVLHSDPEFSSPSPVRGDPEWISTMRELYRRPREAIDIIPGSMILVLLFFFLTLPIPQSIQKSSKNIPAPQKKLFSEPTRIRAP
jgi:hypothetical protein